ncbi:MAG: MFS transporter [Streptosporangiaceae bacterium]
MSSRSLPLAAGATFLAMLDATVANLALPDLHRDLPGTSISGLTWVITLYAVFIAALLAPAGRLCDLLGRRTLYRTGVTVFILASLLCALAPSLSTLLAARALQGAGAAAMVPASLAVLLHDTPAAGRARAIGLWSASAALAAAVGPALGGVLVDSLGWRALFAINVPLGVVLVWSARHLPRGEVGGRLPDLLGTVFLTGGIGAVVLGMTQGKPWGWGDPRILAALGVGTAAIALALWRSARHPVPALEISLWRSRTFAAANLTSFLYGAALYPWLLVGVLFLTQIWDYSELRAGLAMTPGAVTAAVTAILMARLATPRTAVLVGAVFMFGTALWAALTLPAEPSFIPFWLPCGLLIGVGMGALTTGAASAAALSVHPVKFAVATGLNLTARQVGGAFGVAVLAALLSVRDPGVSDFVPVYLYCAVVCAAALAAGLLIRIDSVVETKESVPA